MINIKFEQMRRNWYWLILPFVALIVFFFYHKSLWAQLVFFLTSAFPLLRVFVHKNYVQWSKKQINIRVNDFFGKSISTYQIESIIFKDDEYIILDHYGYEKKINLMNIAPESKARLKEILEIYVN